MSKFKEIFSRRERVRAKDIRRQEAIHTAHSERWVSRLNQVGVDALKEKYIEHFGKLFAGYIVIGEARADSAILEEQKKETRGVSYVARAQQLKAEAMISHLIDRSGGVFTREDFQWGSGAFVIHPASRSRKEIFSPSDILFDPIGVTIFIKAKK